MKLKKRILSFALAVMLIVAMAIPASAATMWATRTGSGCTVAISGECAIVSYSAVMEYQNSDSGDPSDYALQIKLVRRTQRANGTTQEEYPEWSTPSTHITSISGRSDWELYSMKCTCYINGTVAGSSIPVDAN